MTKIRVTRYGWQEFAVKVTSPDQEVFFSLLDSLKANLSERERRYDPDGRRWIVHEGGNFDYWLRLAARVFDAEIDDFREGQGSYQQQYTRPQPVVNPLETAYSVLHLRPTAPLPLVRAARRALATMHHPDAGGDADVMKEINRAADEIERQLQGAA